MATEGSTIRAATARAKATPRGASSRADSATLLTITTAALVLLGLIMILSASFVTSFAEYGSSFLFFKKQLLWAAIGIVAFIACARLDYRKLRGWGYVLLAGVIFALFAVLVPGLGVVAGGSARWLNLGPLSFQPSELGKLALILFAADVFSRKQPSTMREFGHTMLPIVPILAVLGLLIMAQPDMGTTLLIGIIGFGMLFLAGAPARYLIAMGLGSAGIAVMAAIAEPYRRERMLAFLDPWKDRLDSGYQTIQSLIALGSGGWFGVGLGASRQKWMYVPNAHTDFIYSILGEELGLLGTLTVLGLFAFLAYLGIRTARRAPDRFGMFIASGVTLWMAFQALINIGAVTATLPVTGVPLPLVSFGGSSLVVSLVGMGILTNIARQTDLARRKK
ncbi:MAG TPA: putative lipid II flippase FtsW [Actinomycetota bacterium]|nr:putative lipid II flippase FtsW [Actinomycetota bacterium]